jgi:hypothetical protein
VAWRRPFGPAHGAGHERYPEFLLFLGRTTTHPRPRLCPPETGAPALSCIVPFWAANREAGVLRMQQVGVIVTDFSTAMVEILADNELFRATV